MSAPGQLAPERLKVATIVALRTCGYEHGMVTTPEIVEFIEHFKAASTTKFVVVADGPVALTAFNPGYLADALKVVGGDSVLLGVVGPTKPMTISGDSAVNALIMPVRIA